MNLLVVDADREPPRAVPAEVDTVLAPESSFASLRVPGGKLAAVDAATTVEACACRTASGEVSKDARGPIACVHDGAAFAMLEERVLAAAKVDVDGLVLEGLDRPYLAGPRGTGFCDACARSLDERLSRGYGEMYVPSRPLEKLAADEKAPFFRELAAERWQGAHELPTRLINRARDELRRVRPGDARVGARFEALSGPAIALGRQLDFALVPAPAPAPERSRVATYELFLASLGRRELVGVVDRATAATPGLVVQAARLAACVGASIALTADAPDASHAALAGHRQFQKELHTHYRPPERLAEVVLLYSPECDHWTNGRHGGGTRAAAEALTALGAQYRLVTSVPKTGTEPLVVADAGALPEDDAHAIERRLREGGGGIVVGACGTVDEEGRALEGPFEPLAPGLNTAGGRTIFAIDPTGLAEGDAERRFEPLTRELDRALESLVGRGRRAASLRGANLVVKCFLDPDRKLDVHLVGRAYDASSGRAATVKGAGLHLSGAAASGARSGQLFTEDGQVRKVSLTAFGMGVQAQLPEFVGSALFSVAR